MSKKIEFELKYEHLKELGILTDMLKELKYVNDEELDESYSVKVTLLVDEGDSEQLDKELEESIEYNNKMHNGIDEAYTEEMFQYDLTRFGNGGFVKSESSEINSQGIRKQK